MIVALAIILIATASGALASYFYDEDAPVAARVCAGACTGLAALGLCGFVLASFLNLTLLVLALSTVFVAAPLAWLSKAGLRAQVTADARDAWSAVRGAVLRPTWSATGPVAFYLLIALLLWVVFDRALFELPEGLYTGVQNNYGDLPFHLSVINGFARGNNFPPQDPTFAGVRFTYPFLADFVAAMFVRAGASLRGAMFVENFVLALSLVGLLHRWTLVLVRDRAAALIAPVLVLLSGGLGWLRFLREWRASRQTLVDYLAQLSQQYTILGPTWRWGNALTTLLVPQRGILFGLPLAVLIFTLFWRMTPEDADVEAQRAEAAKAKGKTKKAKQRGRFSKGQSANLSVASSHAFHVSTRQRMIAAGVIAGLLPLVHAHTLMVVMLVGGLLAVLREDWRAWSVGMSALALFAFGLDYLSPSAQTGVVSGGAKIYLVVSVAILFAASLLWLLRGPRWREWLAFFVVASLIALPQMWWATHDSAVQATSFLGWHFGWDHADESVWLFWLKNTGLFIPLLLVALVWRWPQPLVSRRVLFYYLPFTLCFIIPNLVLLAPWVWDNIKVLFFWYVASVPLVALLLARLWRAGWLPRFAMVALLLALTLAGALDVWGVVGSEKAQFQVFDRDGIEFAKMLEQQTGPRSLILHAPTFNHPVFLTGRQSYMGYPGHIWTHGLRFEEREAAIKRMYAGGYDAQTLLSSAGIEYVVIGPLERQMMFVDDSFFAQYPLLIDAGGYRLRKVPR